VARARIYKEQRKYGKPWVVRWSWTDSNRKRQSGEQAFHTKVQAEAFATDLNRDLLRGYIPNVGEGRRKLKEYADEWLTSLEDVKPRTREGYRSILDNHVIPTFGGYELREVRRSHVEDYVRALQAKGLTPPTIKQAVSPLVRILDRAVLDDALATNPAKGVRLPTDRSTGRSKPRPKFLTPEQVESLASVLDDHPPYGLLIRFMAYTGLRTSEVAGLRVGDIALGRVNVERTLEKVKDGWREGTPKSARSIRRVPMPKWLVADLRHYLSTVHPRGGDEEAPLWPGRHIFPDWTRLGELDWSEPWERDCFYKNKFKPVLVRAGLPSGVRLHDLRHTYASICASQGIAPVKISRHLGHATVGFTLDVYTHLFPDDDEADMALLGRPVASDRQAVLRVAR
jgi:integrase